MINPQGLEMMIDGIQAGRRNAAKMNSLAMASRSSGPALKEIAYNFIISVGQKMKGQLQVKPGIQQAQGQVEMQVELKKWISSSYFTKERIKLQ